MTYRVSGDNLELLPLLAGLHFASHEIHYDAAAKPAVVTLPDGTSTGLEGSLRYLLAEAATAGPETESLLKLALSRGMSVASDIALSQNSSTLRQLLNMGVRTSRLQTDVYDKIGNDATTIETLAALSSIFSSRMFLSHGGKRFGVLDAVVAGGLHELLALVFPPALVTSSLANSLYSSLFAKVDVVPVVRWFQAATSEPLFADLLERLGLSTGGKVRVGGQVDLRAVPAKVAVLADNSIEKNSGHKKASSQRENEKSAKEPTTPAAPMAGSGDIKVGTATQPEGNKALPSKSVDERIDITMTKLSELGISGSVLRHAAANTVDEMLAALGSSAGTKCKNLFLKAKKEKAPGDSRMWLVVAAHDSDTNLTALATKLGYGKIVLRFGDAESLVENLGVVQGNVSPFALANDTALQVNVAIDARLLAPGASPLYFHPLTNEASVAISSEDLIKFVTTTGHTYTVVDFAAK